jgi:cellulose synthase/poly-beta-1,6-N-acetylglucosamine synthase-like glycosyltransferase
VSVQGTLEESKVALSCTVVVCTRDRPEQLNECLRAISRLHYPKFDVLVVDNAPQNTQAKEIALEWGARYSIEPRPGLSRARNHGAHQCRSEIVAYLDDDSLCEPEWLTALAFEFLDLRVMAVAGLVRLAVFGSGQVYRTQNTNARLIVDRHTANWFEIANFGGIGNGNNMAFRRSAFDVWPGFDERLGRGTSLWQGEEHYAFFSLIDRGYRVAYTPQAIVTHPQPPTMEEVRVQYMKGYAALTGYITLLLVENPRHRLATLKYIFEALRGVQRTWRYAGTNDLPPTSIDAPWRRFVAYLLGPMLYMRSCLNRALMTQ